MASGTFERKQLLSAVTCFLCQKCMHVYYHHVTLSSCDNGLHHESHLRCLQLVYEVVCESPCPAPSLSCYITHHWPDRFSSQSTPFGLEQGIQLDKGERQDRYVRPALYPFESSSTLVGSALERKVRVVA
ncbi:hypothetical protein C8Q74DRAFT_587837 [Fomes fomentarius]|nr:hypothetical protein C8Q74DRAFT_587837 [Fomes fomentarius]